MTEKNENAEERGTVETIIHDPLQEVAEEVAEENGISTEKARDLIIDSLKNVLVESGLE